MKKVALLLVGGAIGYGVSMLLKEKDVKEEAKKQYEQIEQSLIKLENELKEKLKEFKNEEEHIFHHPV